MGTGMDYLQVKVQTIGVIDAILTATMLAALVFRGGSTLWHKAENSYESGLQTADFSPELKEYLQSVVEGRDINNQSGTTKFLIRLTFSGSAVDEEQYERNEHFWLWVFHDVVLAVGLATVIGTALMLVRSTSLEIAPKKAIELVHVWIRGNVVVVAIIAAYFAGMVVTTKSFADVQIFVIWAIIYLAVRTFCTVVVWIYLQELKKQSTPLIAAADEEKTKEEI